MQTNHIISRLFPLIYVIVMSLCFSRCKKLVEVDPPVTSTNGSNVYTTNASAVAVLNGIYSRMSSSSMTNGGIASMSVLPGLSADELVLHTSSTDISLTQYYTNSLNAATNNSVFWINIYPIIYSANDAIEGLTGSLSLAPSIKKQLLGEAKFIRAFCYFYLVNLYEDVPLALSTDYSLNGKLSRAPQSDVWQQIISDLAEAQDLLSSDFLSGDLGDLVESMERTRPTKWAAAALLARVRLYSGDNPEAELQATSVIDNTSMFALVSLSDVFKMNCREAIWQLQPVGTSKATPEAEIFILSTGPESGRPFYLNTDLVNNFDSSDNRKAEWVNSFINTAGTYYFPYKYKVNLPSSIFDEYSVVLRLAELYLIRAEARARQGNISGAKSDLDIIRNRAGLGNTTASDQATLIQEIIREKRFEFFAEWGHRWLDLKRTGMIDSVMNLMTPIKANGAEWQSFQQLYPIPLYELQSAPQLIQNEGY